MSTPRVRYSYPALPHASTRRAVLAGLTGAALLAAATGCSPRRGSTATTPTAATRAEATPTAATPSAATTVPPAAAAPVALRDAAADAGLSFGTSTATWQFADAGYMGVVDAQAALVLTEDDLLWYRIRPAPKATLDFHRPDAFYRRAADHGHRMFGGHLVWDDGFGDGWRPADITALNRGDAEELLYGTLESTVHRYRHRTTAWSVANEVTGPDGDRGLRTDVPWYQAIGAGYVAGAFHRARAIDADAVLVLNEFGFETTDQYGADPLARRRATLTVLDRLLGDGVPVDALGIQAHLTAVDFKARFDGPGYRRFLAEVAQREVEILITELDVLDDGLPADPARRDRGVADVYRRYLDVALDESLVSTVVSFGLADRYTWLQEDYPRDDGSDRRPLAYGADLQPKPARGAIEAAFTAARRR